LSLTEFREASPATIREKSTAAYSAPSIRSSWRGRGTNEFDFGKQAELMADVRQAVIAMLAFVLFFSFIVLTVRCNSLKLLALILGSVPFCLMGLVFGLSPGRLLIRRDGAHRHPRGHRCERQRWRTDDDFRRGTPPAGRACPAARPSCRPPRFAYGPG
jgi:hypothetical protein